MENQTNGKTDLGNVKAQFDEVLVQHIRRLLEIETMTTSLSFNHSTIACLFLLVERENDIKSSPESPPERYTREMFLEDLTEIGVEIDDTLMVSFQALAQQGYLAIDTENRYNAQITAFATVSFLDNLFPGMRGLSLVAYVLQMMDEVTSGRKELNEALDQFDQTLLSKGIPLSKQTLENVKEESTNKLVQPVAKKVETKKITEDEKQTLDQKLSRLRTGNTEGLGAPSKGKVKIKEIFPKGPTEEEIRAKEAEEKAAQEVEEKAIKEAAEKAAKEAEQIAAEKAAQEAEERAAELATQEAATKAAEMAAREAEMKAKEAEIRAREAEIAAMEAEKAKAEEAAQEEQEASKVDVEKKMAAFEQQIAIACPVCQMGKIISDTTEKGQEFFSCTNENCGFVSWGKPYPYNCPICSNQFLIEFTTQEGRPGLKCPRSTCSFWQSQLGPPSQDNESSDKPKKRKKLIRRVKRKR